MNFADIDFQVGSVNPSGIAQLGYYIPKADIASWPTIDDDPESADATIAGISTYSTDFVLDTGKKWKHIYSTSGKGKVTFEGTGETDCKMYLNKATLSYPRITDDIRAFAKAAVNGDFVFVIKHDGKYFVIGHPDYRTTVTPGGDTGDAAGSAKGVTIELECPDVTPMPRYSGELVITEGSLDCDTDVITAGT